jgi:hypothetical protein
MKNDASRAEKKPPPVSAAIAVTAAASCPEPSKLTSQLGSAAADLSDLERRAVDERILDEPEDARTVKEWAAERDQRDGGPG